MSFPRVLPDPPVSLDLTGGYPPGIWRHVSTWHRIRFSFCWNPEFAYWDHMERMWKTVEFGPVSAWFMRTQPVDKEPFAEWFGSVGRSVIPWDSWWKPR